LYYRINVFQITLPPLRERPEDVLPLAEYFASRYAAKNSLPMPQLTPAYLQRLQAMPWPGNVRELKNAVERSVILSDNGALSPDTLPQTASTDVESLELAHVERRHIQAVLQSTAGNKPEAARLLGIGLSTLYRKLEEYKLQ
jgi:DNA-binding NtrC family response regulator